MPDFFLKKRVTTLVLFLALVLFGGISLKNLKMELLPDISFPTLTIVTIYDNVAPSEIESLVTRPIEEMVSSVAGVDQVSSESIEGVSIIRVRFSWGTDMDQASIQTREKVDLVRGSLPQDVKKSIVLRFDPNNAPLLQLAVKPKGIPLNQIRSFIKKNIRPYFEKVDGVAALSVSGGFERQILVHVDRGALQGYGVGLGDLVTQIGSGNFNFPAGNIKRGEKEVLVRTMGQYRRVDTIGEIVVGMSEAGVPFYLKNLARVQDGFKERTSRCFYNGAECIAMVVKKEAGKNTVSVADALRDTVAKINKKYGKELEIQIVSDKSVFIRESIQNVVSSGLLAVIICYFVLLFFLGRIREPMIVLASIPVSIMVTFLLMNMQGLTLNVMSLGGLAVGVGMMVDSSTVVLESIYQYKEQGLPIREAASKGTKTVIGSVFSSTLTSCVVFLPIVFVSGMAGAIFRELALTITYALVSSLLVSLTLIPVLTALPFFNGQSFSGDESRFAFFGRVRVAVLNRIGAFYERLLRFSFVHRGMLYLGALMITALTVLLFYMLPAELMPDVDQGEFSIVLIAPEGSSLAHTSHLTERMLGIIQDTDLALVAFAKVGYEERDLLLNPRSDFGLNRGSIFIRLKPGNNTEASIDLIRSRLVNLAVGAELTLKYEPVKSLLADLFAAEGSGLVIEVAGQNLEGIKDITAALSSKLQKTGAFKEVYTGFRDRVPELRVELDRDRMAFLGLNVQDVAVNLKAAVKGEVATKYRQNDEEIDVLVRLRAEDRTGNRALGELSVPGPKNKSFNLRSFARVEPGFAPRKIERREGKRIGRVFASYQNMKQSQAEKLISPFLEEYRDNQDYSVLAGELKRETAKSFEALLFAGLLALLLVYMVLASQFEHIFMPLVVMLSVLVVGFGAAFLLLIAGQSINIVSMMGMVMLAGLVVNNAIVLIEYFQQGVDADPEINPEDLVVAGVRRRINPILNTTTTTVLGLLPLIISIGGPTPQAGMALTVIGGLLFSTILTLVLIPNAYITFFFRKKGGGKT